MNFEPKILVVDDELGVCISISMILYGFEIVTASNVGQAQGHFIEDKNFALVISDFHMPDGTGLEFYQWVRQRSEIPFLMISAAISELRNEPGLRFLAKPFDVQELRDEVAYILAPEVRCAVDNIKFTALRRVL